MGNETFSNRMKGIYRGILVLFLVSFITAFIVVSSVYYVKRSAPKTIDDVEICTRQNCYEPIVGRISDKDPDFSLKKRLVNKYCRLGCLTHKSCAKWRSRYSSQTLSCLRRMCAKRCSRDRMNKICYEVCIYARMPKKTVPQAHQARKIASSTIKSCVLRQSVGLGIAFLIYLTILGWILRSSNTSISGKARGRIQALLNVATPIATILSTAIFLWLAFSVHGRVTLCRSWFSIHSEVFVLWLLLFTNIYIFVRNLAVWLVSGFQPNLFSTFVDTWILVQTMYGPFTNKFVYAFMSVTIGRLLYSDTTAFMSLCIRLKYPTVRLTLRVVIDIIVVMFVLAGFFQSAMEWNIEDCLHPTKSAVFSMPYSSFIYYTVVTVSTVGYGDILPTTTFAKVVCVFVVVLGIPWFAKNCQYISDSISYSIKSDKNHKPILQMSCCLVVVGSPFPARLQNFLFQFKQQKVTGNIILVDKEPSDALVDVVEKERLFVCSSLTEAVEYVVKENVTVLILNDLNFHGTSKADDKVLQLAHYVKQVLPSAKIVVGIQKKLTRQLLETVVGWKQENDSIICHEELISSLVHSTRAVPGAASLLNSMIHCPQFNRFPETCLCWENFCLGQQTWMECVEVHKQSNFSILQYEMYKKFGKLLLLLIKAEKVSAAIYLRPSNPVRVKDKYLTSSSLKVDNITVGIDLITPISLPQKTRSSFPTTDENGSETDMWDSSPQEPTALFDYYKQRQLFPNDRIVTTAKYMDPELEKHLPRVSHKYVDVVDQDSVLNAVAFACTKPDLYSAWCKVVNKEFCCMKGNISCYYGQALDVLIKRNILCLGVVKKCDLHPPLPILHPSCDFKVEPCDLLITYKV